MKVVFVSEVLGTASPGEVKDVKPGFARNYLFPRKLAVPATTSAMQMAQALAKKDEKRQNALDNEARAIVEKLEGQNLVIQARAGDQGRLYGSVTPAAIAERVGDIIGGEFDRRQVLLQEPIRAIGSYVVTLRLTRNISHALPVDVQPDDGSRRRVASAPLPPIIPDEPDDDDDDMEDDD